MELLRVLRVNSGTELCGLTVSDPSTLLVLYRHDEGEKSWGLTEGKNHTKVGKNKRRTSLVSLGVTVYGADVEPFVCALTFRTRTTKRLVGSRDGVVASDTDFVSPDSSWRPVSGGRGFSSGNRLKGCRP